MALLVILGITLIILGLLSLLFMYLEDEKYNYQDYKLGLLIVLAGIVLMFIASLKDISKENNSNSSKKVQVIETNESINSNTVKYFINLELIQEVMYIPKESPLMDDYEGEALLEITMIDGSVQKKLFPSKKEALNKYEEIKKHLKVIDF